MFYEYANQMPELTRSSENGAIEKISVSFNLPKSYDWKGDLPAVGDYVEPYGYYTGRNVRETPGYNIVTMSFSEFPTNESPSRENRKAGDTVWNFHLYTYDSDIRQHHQYLANWNYSVAISPEVSDTEAHTLKTTGRIGSYNIMDAKDITIEDKELRKKIRWVSDASELPEGWSVCILREFTFDSYKDFTANATKIEYFKTYDAASGAVPTSPASLKKPEKVIPFTSNESRDWMIDDISCGGDGDLFTLTTIYQYYSPGWTQKVYGNPAN